MRGMDRVFLEKKLEQQNIFYSNKNYKLEYVYLRSRSPWFGIVKKTRLVSAYFDLSIAEDLGSVRTDLSEM